MRACRTLLHYAAYLRMAAGGWNKRVAALWRIIDWLTPALAWRRLAAPAEHCSLVSTRFIAMLRSRSNVRVFLREKIVRAVPRYAAQPSTHFAMYSVIAVGCLAEKAAWRQLARRSRMCRIARAAHRISRQTGRRGKRKAANLIFESAMRCSPFSSSTRDRQRGMTICIISVRKPCLRGVRNAPRTMRRSGTVLLRSLRFGALSWRYALVPQLLL